MSEERAGPVDGEVLLARVLRLVSEEGRFKDSVLASAEGLPLPSASSPFDIETMAALVRSTSERVREDIRLDVIDEVSVVHADLARIVRALVGYCCCTHVAQVEIGLEWTRVRRKDMCRG